MSLCAPAGRSYAKIGAMPADRIVVYTGGACLGNPGPGGWGWVVPGGEWNEIADQLATGAATDQRSRRGS